MRKIRCAIYTRKSSEEGLEQDFNSLHAQREACAAYVASQKAEGWVLLPDAYDDGGLSGGTLERPALHRLLEAIDQGLIDQIVVYKIDRLTRSLADFAKIVDRLDGAGASFVSVTQSFNTATSMGRLTLNMLLSFAQFEREVTAERIRDKISASKRRGLWMGGNVPIGYEADGRSLRIDPTEAETVRSLFRLYQKHGSVRAVKREADRLELRSKSRLAASGEPRGGGPFDRGHIYYILTNPVYAGRIRHRKTVYPGQHPPIVDPDLWDSVQMQLQAEAAKPRTAEPTSDKQKSFSPLIGKLFDETGDRLTPSHTKTKAGKRLRYYVSHRLIRRSGESQVTGWRLPAPGLENGIAHLLQRHVQMSSFLSRVLPDADADDLHRLSGRMDDLPGQAKGNNAALLFQLVEHIHIAPGDIRITLDAAVLAQHLGVPVTRIASEALTIAAPFQQRKRGVETRLILSDGQHARDDVLLRNMAKAQQWLEAIKNGKSYDEVAAETGTTRRRVQQIIGLALLAPDITRDAIQGHQPVGFTTRWFLRHPMPSDWDAQRRLIRAL